MAAGASNRFLFLDESGEAVHFYMPPCKERKQLKPIIEAGGGTISSKVEPACIKLAVPGQTVKGGDLVLAKYVTDCVDADELLDVLKYRIDPANPPEDDGEVVSDFETAELPITKGSSKMKQGRQKYLLSEDMNIIKYILDEQLYGETGGNKMWQDMAGLHIVNHSWQSTRDRFLKQIVPNINSYNITKHKMALLTNTFVMEEDGDSPDKKIRSPRKSYSSPTKKKIRKESGQETIPNLLNKKNDSVLIPDIPVEFDNLDRELLAMACTDEEPSETIAAISSTSSKNKPNTESTQPQPEIINAETDSNGNIEKTTEEEQGGETSEAQAKTKKNEEDEKQKATKDSQPDSEIEMLHVTVSSSDSRETSRSARNSIKEVSKDTVALVESDTRDTLHGDSPTRPQTIGSKSANNVDENQNEESLIEEIHENKRRSSTRKHAAAAETQRDADSADDEDSPSVISPRRSKRARLNEEEKINEVAASNKNNNNASKPVSEPTGKTSGAPHKAVRALRDFICSPTASQPATMSESPNNGEEQEKLCKAEKIFKRTCRWLDIQEEELLSVLWMTSGGLKDAVTWILSGGSSIVPVWREEDDDRLDKDDLEPLHERFGDVAVGERLHFLAENRY